MLLFVRLNQRAYGTIFGANPHLLPPCSFGISRIGFCLFDFFPRWFCFIWWGCCKRSLNIWFGFKVNTRNCSMGVTPQSLTVDGLEFCQLFLGRWPFFVFGSLLYFLSVLLVHISTVVQHSYGRNVTSTLSPLETLFSILLY